MKANELFNKAAGELKHGYHILITLENGYGGAELMDPEFNMVEFDNNDLTLEQQILECIKISNENKEQKEEE